MNASRHPHRRGGFTLLELAVATTLSLIVVGLILHLFSSVSTLWRYSEERIDTEREARAALDRIRRDLEHVVRLPPIAPGDPSPEVLRIGYTPSGTPESRSFEELQALVFLPNQGESDLCAVAYRCAWDEEARCYVLLRSLRGSNATLAALLAPPASAETPEEASDAPETTSHEEPLARYIWDLTFRPILNGAPAPTYPDTAYSDPLPIAIEIRFNALGSLAIEKLKAFPITEETWRTPDDPLFTRLIAQHARAYVIRVPLHAGQR